MGIIGAIILGLIVGALAKLIMPGDDPGGIIVTTLIGIVGSFLGGALGQWVLGQGNGGFFDLRTWVLGIIGSLILLVIYRVIVGRRSKVRR
ncbi:GlsB/YeaQ/YmgE family stress response membrane protein [Actinomycetospora sp. CA-101289]|uniref:GlsB/YeaQ/YmgE family stress response membrane protein n=1 Tax=Actinomycetospora sp. CA-101289 TaxID=3239893 RepID=UPI003D97708F